MICYALYSSAEPSHMRYIGATTHGAQARLTKHLASAESQRRTDLRNWIMFVLRAGNLIKIRVLSEHHTLAELSAAESKWIGQYRMQGHWLFNRSTKKETPATWNLKFRPARLNYDASYIRYSEHKPLVPATSTNADSKPTQ